MTVVHTSTRSTLGLSANAPSSVTTYSANITVSGITVSMPVTDGTDGADTISAPTTGYVFGFGGNDTISNSGSAAVLLGGAGTDTFQMYNNSSLSSVSDGSILDFEGGTDILNLSQFTGLSSFSQLTITNNTDGTPGSFAQITNTSAGLNIIVSGTGLDSLTSSSFVFSGSTDTGTGGGTTIPTVTIPGTTAADTLTGTSGGDVIFGGGSIVAPTDLADSIVGGLGADYILGNAGADTIYGGTGSSDSTDGSDTIYGGVSTDLIIGNAGNDSLYGGGGTADPNESGDTIYGGLGNDYILGNGGNDVLYGQNGNDTLHGGNGDDTYCFNGFDGLDVILHFTGAGGAGGDVLQLTSDLNGSGITTTALALAAVSYSNGNAVVNLGSGHSVTIYGLAENSLIESDFTIV